MTKTKRILPLVLTLIMCFSMFSGLAINVAAASNNTSYLIAFPRGGDPNRTGWGQADLSLMNGWRTSPTSNVMHLFAMGSYNGQIAYCIEPGVPLKTGDSFTEKGEDYWDNYPSNLNSTISPDIIKAYIGRIFQYAYTGNVSTSWMSNTSDGNYIAHAIASQILIWETVIGERDSKFNKVDASTQVKSNIKDIIAVNHPLRDLIFSYYHSMEAQVQQHSKLPSFFSPSTNATPYELTWNGSEYSITLTDTNNVLGNYSFSASQTGVNISASGNKLTITSEKAPTSNIAITANKANGMRSGVVVWTDGVIAGGEQNLVTHSATVSDPVRGFLNLKVSYGAVDIIKTSEDGNVSGIDFTILGEDINQTVTTNSEGKINIPNLVPGIYTVTEKSYDKYEPQNSQAVTVVSGQTSTVTFNNVLKRGSLEVQKTSEDNFIEGITFRLFGTSLSGAPVDEYAVTDANGIATFSNVIISGTTPYTLEEIETATRYVVPESQSASINWNEVTNRNFTNILKKFAVTVTKTDVETVSPQGNATLSGAVYGIYKDETLIDTYTTDVNGQFTTKEYICDTDWTIREITPSEGYLLDTTIHKVGAEAELYTVEHNLTSNNVTEQVAKGNIAIIKHSDNGDTQIETPESGATFEVYLKSSGSYEAAKDSEKDIIVCDENGFAQTKLMPYGIYTVHQTVGVEGSELMKDFDVFISKDGETYRYIINNAPFESYVKVVKKDSETGNVIPYAGAGFKIYDPSGNLISMTFTYPTPTTIDTFYTDENGTLVTPEKLDYGTGYSLVEVTAPYGYVLDSTPVYFDATEENSESENDITIIEIVKENTPQKGTVKITKTGEIFESVTNNNDIYQPVFSASTLEGATYEIIAAEDIYTPDGTLRVSSGEIVDTITTDNTGTATSQALYLGKYNVKETVAPHGMVLNNDLYEIELSYQGQEIEITESNIAFNNERQKVSVNLVKSLEIDDLFDIGTNEEILDVMFGLYANEDITANDGTFIPKDSEIEKALVNEDGIIVFDTDLTFGSYYVKEIATNEAYIISDEKYEFTFEYAGQDINIVTIDINDGKAITNDIIRSDVNGIKYGENSELLGGAKIGLFKANETVFTEETALMTTTSNDDGSFSFVDIPYGVYVVREIEAPTAYVLSTALFGVFITGEETEAIIIEIENTKIRGDVTLTKVDADYPENKLTGATFEVYQDTNSNKEFDKKDVLVSEMSELADGVYLLEDLLYGGYFVKETIAPLGFILDETVYYFEITENEVAVIVETESDKGFMNAAQKGHLKIEKTSADGVLEGFTFRVEGVDFMGNPYSKDFITDKNGEIFIENLRIGEYTIRELETEASEKYKLPDNQTVNIENGKTVTAEFYNDLEERPEVPKTGDETNPTLWLVVALLSLSGIVITSATYIIKRKRDNE